jgi:predicted metal-dependent hydrolase
MSAGARRGARRVGDELRVRVPAGGDPSPVIERWYRREASAHPRSLAERWASALGVRVGGVAIRDPRSRWGSCSPAGGLSFSWRLILAPGFVAAHVAAHEACHLVRPDHSPAFWRLLGDLDPLTPHARAWLRSHGERLHDGPTWRNGAPAGRCHAEAPW